MSRSGARHDQKISLEPDWGTGQVQFRALTRDKAEMLDISGLGVRHVWLLFL
jgi:hypothetical protein